jgi:hypothetical protein
MARSRRTNRHVRGEKVVVGHATQKKREALLSASRVVLTCAYSVASDYYHLSLTASCMLNCSPGPSPGAPLKSPIVSVTVPKPGLQ